MNYSKQILKALILAFLLAPVGMKAMEKPSFIDCNGKEVTLNRAQQEAFEQCEIVREFKELNPKAEITFEGAKSQVLKTENILALLDLLSSQSLGVKEFTVSNMLAMHEMEKAIELFQLANCLGVPKEQMMLIADAIYGHVKSMKLMCEQEYNEGPAKKEKLAELTLLQATVEPYLSYCVDGSERVRRIKNDPMTKDALKILVKDNSLLYLGRDTEPMLILNGIEDIVSTIPEAKSIKMLNLFGNQLSTIDITSLRKAFPDLEEISIRKNKFDAITSGVADQKLKILLAEGNNINSICLDNPSQFNKLKIRARNNPVTLDNVIFKQTTLRKMLTWLKAFGAQGKIAFFYISKPTFLLLWGSCLIGTLLGIPDRFEVEGLQKGLKQFLMASLKQYVQDAKNKRYGVVFALGVVPYLLERLGSYLSGYVTHCLNEAAQDNPYAVRVETDSGVKEFPSPYTYKLFGKK